ncbi:hypothetical protein L226DRAFT_445138, partial [Lentinus tigrinus ALCF2SS1-7]
AAPYSLNNGNCGHVFCAMCLLRWAFEALHLDCGHWHDRLQCPLCRAYLPDIPQNTPRSLATFPFVPNRTTSTTLEFYVNLLKN